MDRRKKQAENTEGEKRMRASDGGRRKSGKVGQMRGVVMPAMAAVITDSRRFSIWPNRIGGCLQL